MGIDIGTTTSHLIFSELGLERQGIRLSSAYAVVERTVVHRSDVTLTPYSSPSRIDTDALRSFIDRAYRDAGWTRDMVDSGAVIATGEAARKENAAAIVGLFSDQAGRFVCATAGHHLESLLAAHGSGAVALSRSEATPLVLNVDIGGGTTKLAVCRRGRVEETAALDIGARVVSWDWRTGKILTVTRAGERLAREVGLTISPGEIVDDADLDALAKHIASSAMAVAATPAPPSLVNVPRVDELPWLTDRISSRGPFTALVFSGGVGEYINGSEERGFGDLGPRVARHVRLYTVALGAMRAQDEGVEIQVVPAVESIRATCIGASQYTVQVSGDTLYLSDRSLLPLHDLAAIAVRPAAASAEAIAREVRGGIARLDREDGRFALAVRWTHGPAYAALRELAQGIADGTRSLLRDTLPLVVVVDADIAGIVGQMLRDEMGVVGPVLCVDQIALSDLDFIDIGAVVADKEVVPVVVKSLVFAER